MRRFVAFVALVALATSSAACSSDKGNDKPTGESKVARPRRGGTLRLGVTKLKTLDPAQARTVEQSQVADLLFDGLTTYDPKTLDPVPALADTWASTDDQKSWTFRLRPGIVFANGRAITSTDVKYSIERIVKKGSGANNADLLENVTGYLAFAIEGSAAELAGVTAPAPEIVRIDLDAPLATLPSILGNPGFGVVPKEEVERAEGAVPFAQEPVGSGPFAVKSAANGVVTLVQTDASKAYVAAIDLVQFEDVSAAYAAFGKGEVDWTRVPPTDVAEAATKYGRGHYTAYLAELFFGFNLKSPTFANPKFRAAILAAINRRAIVDAVYDATVSRLDGIVVPDLRSSTDSACGDNCIHDLEKAKRLVGEAFGTGSPPDVPIDYDEDPTYDAVAKAIQSNLREAGIPATLRPQGLVEYRDFVVSGNQQLFRFGWIAAYPSPDAFLYPLFFSSSRSNLVGLASGPVDDQLRAARGSGDPAARVGAWAAAEQAILAEIPVVPLAQFQIHALVSKRVRGLKTLPTGTFDATKLWLTKS